MSRDELAPGNITYPNAQSRIEAGLSEPTAAGLASSRQGESRLSRTEQQGAMSDAAHSAELELSFQLSAAAIRAARPQGPHHNDRQTEIITVEEHAARDPRGLSRATRIGEIVIVEKAKEGSKMSEVTSDTTEGSGEQDNETFGRLLSAYERWNRKDDEGDVIGMTAAKQEFEDLLDSLPEPKRTRMWEQIQAHYKKEGSK